MYDKYRITPSKADQIIQNRISIMNSVYYQQEFFIVLYEEPEGSPRPRARYINKGNVINSAKSYPGFIQIYSLTGKSDRQFMKRMIDDGELNELGSNLIYTPCSVDYTAYIKTPKSFNANDTFLAELQCIRPICKPDFDNIAKKYSDMYNGNIWIDDALVMDGSVHKYYSILPRIEIRVRFLNMLYNKYQYTSVQHRLPDRTDLRYFGDEAKKGMDKNGK